MRSDKTTPIALTVIGSRGVTVDVAPAALPDAGPGGIALTIALRDGPLTLTLTRSEALRLVQLLLQKGR